MVLSRNAPLRASVVVSWCVVSMFRRVTIQTKAPSTFQMFEFELRSARNATIAMVTPDTPVHSLEDRSRDGESRNAETAFGITSFANKNARFVRVIQKIRGYFVSNF